MLTQKALKGFEILKGFHTKSKNLREKIIQRFLILLHFKLIYALISPLIQFKDFQSKNIVEIIVLEVKFRRKNDKKWLKITKLLILSVHISKFATSHWKVFEFSEICQTLENRWKVLENWKVFHWKVLNSPVCYFTRYSLR